MSQMHLSAKRATPLGGATPASWHRLHGTAMGTTWTVTMALDGGTPVSTTLHASICAVLQRITRQMSNWDDDSTLTALNRAETGWYQLPEELFHVLAHALLVAEQTDGAYDPALGILNNLWGFGPAGAIAIPPTRDAIEAALSQSGWKRTAIDHGHRAIWQPGGLCFDLSSIGKGYAVDAVSALLDEHNLAHYLVEIGGELKAKGLGPTGEAWNVAVEIPRRWAIEATGLSSGQPDADDTDEASLPVSLEDCAIATSGDYRRFFDYEGRRYSHTLDPASGCPVVHTLLSVSVLHRDCMMADALSTALYSMGLARAQRYARINSIPALFMTRQTGDIQMHWTAGFSMPAGAVRN